MTSSPLNRRSSLTARRARSSGLTPPRMKPSLTSMCRDLPPVVYFMRTTDGLIKIGYTANLANRKTKFGSGWQHILAVLPGAREDEAALLTRFADHLAHGAEYFHPAPELIAYINEVRATLGVGPTA